MHSYKANRHLFYEIGDRMEGFIELLVKRGLSNRTINEYVKVVRAFEASNQSVGEFLLTHRQYLNRFALQHWLKYNNRLSELDGFVDENKHALRQQKKNVRPVFTPKEIKRIISFLPHPADVAAMIQLDTGARASAVLDLRISRIEKDEESDTYIILMEKGERQVVKYLSPQVAKVLNTREFYTYGSDKVFYGLSYQTYRYKLLEASKAAEINGWLTSHDIRRARAIHLLRLGENIETVKRELGHKSIVTTSIYLQASGLDSKTLNKKINLWSESDD